MDFPSALNKLWPKAKQQTRQAIIACYEEEFAKWDHNPLVTAHFMAQISHECMGGTIVRENMNYRADRIIEIFGEGKHSAKVTAEEASTLAGQPFALAERVYGISNPKKARELGNTRPGDGYRFRGGGMLQLTGGANYRKRGDAIGYNLYENPEQLENPTISFKVAVAEFIGLGCVQPAKRDDIRAVTLKVNGGTNGLADRTVWLRKWKEALDGVEAPIPAPREAELDKPPSFLGTRTGQLTTVATTASTVATVSQVAQQASTVSDQVQVVAENGKQVVETVKVVTNFLGLSPHTWAQIGIAAAVLCLAAAIGIGVYRWLKIKEKGE